MFVSRMLLILFLILSSIRVLPFKYVKCNTMEITWNDFEKVEMRVGTIIEVNDFPNARKPAFQLTIDFGSQLGIRKSSAQITKRYHKEELLNRQ